MNGWADTCCSIMATKFHTNALMGSVVCLMAAIKEKII
jgi:hypothetical protein